MNTSLSCCAASPITVSGVECSIILSTTISLGYVGPGSSGTRAPRSVIENLRLVYLPCVNPERRFNTVCLPDRGFPGALLYGLLGTGKTPQAKSLSRQPGPPRSRPHLVMPTKNILAKARKFVERSSRLHASFVPALFSLIKKASSRPAQPTIEDVSELLPIDFCGGGTVWPQVTAPQPSPCWPQLAHSTSTLRYYVVCPCTSSLIYPHTMIAWPS